ncbi:MAG: hypothetical protein HQL43_00460 [Alphaproteobacteria bacterium]|nr:hypothetical protein [Alphaproteobacteria bacterium]
MKYLKIDDAEMYHKLQIQACRKKVNYCKFSYSDAEKYILAIADHKKKSGNNDSIGPILCLGVRNGREIDCFRTALSGSLLQRIATKYLEIKRFGLQSRYPLLESIGRSSIKNGISPTACFGVEINPDVKRSDILNCSFDALPREWDGQFGLVYSNAFDHGRDPQQVALSWWRMVRPGGYLVLGFPHGQQPGEIDPIGDVTLEDACSLFPGELVFFQKMGSVWTYTEYMFNKSVTR